MGEVKGVTGLRQSMRRDRKQRRETHSIKDEWLLVFNSPSSADDAHEEVLKGGVHVDILVLKANVIALFSHLLHQPVHTKVKMVA